ncbi:uncharacterized protein BO88DRAFT_426795 [Aspergillus vadensis CBS 113365]|uniref:Uncharacterized protein n=1 Tax=Aspergillus vadensis (strain CBS 113365 / IMI 142717 / IBT 24658) TaxID=1448311 RepID=A0A319BPC3_ASPVC|nr:hypothetical protein BO88DRAFT_426795 [Aspergillus vadensis CBS 113365]PYH67563.1 hypothetical protein BO88DRAFT_426795 [Aspergillus vadensis CBS 113365]
MLVPTGWFIRALLILEGTQFGMGLAMLISTPKMDGETKRGRMEEKASYSNKKKETSEARSGSQQIMRSWKCVSHPPPIPSFLRFPSYPGKVAVLTWFKVLPQPCGRLPTSNGSHRGHMRNPSRINKSATAPSLMLVMGCRPLRGPRPGGSKSPNDSWLRRTSKRWTVHSSLSLSPHDIHEGIRHREERKRSQALRMAVAENGPHNSMTLLPACQPTSPSVNRQCPWLSSGGARQRS